MTKTMSGAELSRLLLRSGTTAAEIVAMDVEDVAKVVAYRRQKKARGPVDSAMTDEQIARAILEYAQSEPSDWPVPPRATPTEARRTRSMLLGALGGGVGGVAFLVVGALVLYDAGSLGGNALGLTVFAPMGALCGAILGGIVALVATRAMTGTGLLKRVILPLAAGLAASFILVAGFILWLLADAGELNRYIRRSGDSLLERYQAGYRTFYDWNLRGADLSGAIELNPRYL